MSTITLLTLSEAGDDSMSTINTNFTNINNDLISAESDIEALEALLPSAPATTSLKGLTRLSVAPVSPTAPIVVGDNDTRLPSQNENDALVGTSGTPSSSNKFVTATDPAYTGIVSLSGDQTIGGTKTFSSIPILPASDPTTANQAVRKSYVDGLVSVTTGTITITSEGALGSGTVHYKKRGKLYYDIYFAGSGGVDLFFTNSTSLTRIMVALGSIAGTPSNTINNYGAYTATYNGSTWTLNTPTNETRVICSSFLAS